MQLVTDEIREQLLANGRNRDQDHTPVVKFFSPVGAATWLITEMDPEMPDLLFGLADLGFGCPELGDVSLRELESITFLGGALGIERDLHWTGEHPISVYAAISAKHGRLIDRPDPEDVKAIMAQRQAAG
jgi:hypothetical protein